MFVGFILSSITSGIVLLGALSFELNGADEAQQLELYSTNVRWSAVSQLVTFVPAVFLFGLFVVLNLPGAIRSSPARAIMPNGPVIANGPVTASGGVTATGPLTATGVVSATGSVTATGPVRATGQAAVRTVVSPHRGPGLRHRTTRTTH